MEIALRGKAVPAIGFSITLLSILLLISAFAPFETIERSLYDARFLIRGAEVPRHEIVIAAIDEKSLDRLGRWPWSRTILARLINTLADGGAELIVLDIILSEADRRDSLVAKAMRRSGIVLMPIVFDFETQTPSPSASTLEQASMHSITHEDRFRTYPPLSAKGILFPASRLREEAMALGHINMTPDSDGVLRRETLAVEYGGYLFPSLDLVTASVYLGVPPEKVVYRAAEGISVGEKTFLPTDTRGAFLIPYYGPIRTFPHISIADIIDGTVRTDRINGKIVIVGATAMGIYDMRVTPFYAAMPGVEKHAHVIASILEGKKMLKASQMTDISILAVSGLLFSLLIVRFRAGGGALLALLFLGMLASAGCILFGRMGIWINLTSPLLNIAAIFVSVTAYKYAVEERSGRKIKAMFSSYVTERVVNELIRNPAMAKLGGDRREVTVLFSDLKGFTGLSEKHPPEEIVSLLNEYLAEMTSLVFKYEGTLDKFIGDAILAFWNAPLEQPDHAERAVQCALDMIVTLAELRKKWEQEGKPPLYCGIGINTGEVLVGNIGAEGKKMDYTVIGDHVNLGSRVEALTRKYEHDIIITEYTLEKIRFSIQANSFSSVIIAGLDRVSVKGRENPVGLYTIKRNPVPGSPSVIEEIVSEEVIVFREK